jgi:hypothetical protein
MDPPTVGTYQLPPLKRLRALVANRCSERSERFPRPSAELFLLQQQKQILLLPRDQTQAWRIELGYERTRTRFQLNSPAHWRGCVWGISFPRTLFALLGILLLISSGIGAKDTVPHCFNLLGLGLHKFPAFFLTLGVSPISQIWPG